MARIRNYAVETLSKIPDLEIVGRGTAPHILSVSLVGWPSQNIVNDLGSQGICISAGSACHQGKPSHVVAALKLPKKTAGGVIRLSFGPETAAADIDACDDDIFQNPARVQQRQRAIGQRQHRDDDPRDDGNPLAPLFRLGRQIRRVLRPILRRQRRIGLQIRLRCSFLRRGLVRAVSAQLFV